MKLKLRLVAPGLSALFVAAMVLAGMVIAAGPANNNGARRDYRIRNVDPNAKDDPNDGRLWRISEFSLWSENSSYEGKPATVLKREDRSVEGDRVLIEVTAAPDLRPYQTRRTVYTRQNKMIEDNTIIYANIFQSFPAGTIDFMTIPWAMERIDLTIGARSDCWLTFGAEMQPWQWFLIPEAEETVTVPAGTFKCVRVKMEPSLDKLPGFFRVMPKFLVQLILSDSFGWVTTDTHIMVKFQGKLDGPGSPEKVEELVRIGR